MNSNKSIRNIIATLLFTAIFLNEFHCSKSAYAATLQFYNYNTNAYVNYTGKQVVYTYNDMELSLSHPGIIIDGIALADCID